MEYISIGQRTDNSMLVMQGHNKGEKKNGFKGEPKSRGQNKKRHAILNRNGII